MRDNAMCFRPDTERTHTHRDRRTRTFNEEYKLGCMRVGGISREKNSHTCARPKTQRTVYYFSSHAFQRRTPKLWDCVTHKLDKQRMLCVHIRTVVSLRCVCVCRQFSMACYAALRVRKRDGEQTETRVQE